MVIQSPRYLFSVEDYHRMAQARIFQADDRLELIEGEVVRMSPIGPGHAGCVNRLVRLLVERLGRRAVVAAQNPVELRPRSEPQPDVSVLRPVSDCYSTRHPNAAETLLVIEVADTTLESDRGVKLPLYARSGIAEAWIVDLVGQAIEASRVPGVDGYAEVRRLGSGGELRIAAFPDVVFGVDEILGTA